MTRVSCVGFRNYLLVELRHPSSLCVDDRRCTVFLEQMIVLGNPADTVYESLVMRIIQWKPSPGTEVSQHL